MEYTNSLRLKKPGYTDKVDVKDFNDNFDTIDMMNNRVSNLLNELTENPESADAMEVADIRTGYDGTIHETAGDAVRAVGQDLKDLGDALEDFKNAEAVDDLDYDSEENRLYLTANGARIGEGVEIISGSGGGGGGSTSIVKLVSENESTAISAALNNSVVLKFRFTSTEDDVPTGNGTAKLVVNGATKATFNVPQGSNELEIKDYLSEGSNVVRLMVSDVYGVSKSLNYTVSVIALSITSNFDATAVQTGDITFKFTPVGLVEKTVKFYVDGTLDSTMVVSASGKQNTKVFSAMSHGSHKLVVYCEAVVDETTITSNRLVYDLICIEDGETDVIIASPFENGSISEGELIEIPFSIYDPSNLTADAVLTITDGNGTVYSTQNRTVDRTQQIWSTRLYPTGTTTFTIACGSVSKVISMTVSESDIPVEAETEDLALYLTAAGRSNSEANPDVWSYDEITTTFSDMNWVNNGWVADNNGDIVLRLNGKATAVINMTPFASDARLNGKTIEMEFAIRDVSNRDAVAISCIDGGIGFQATADRMVLTSEQSSVECRYKDDERIRVAFTIEPRSEYRLLCVYLNGVLSGSVQYPDNDNFQQPVPCGISMGSEYCSIDVYAVRVYDTALTRDQVRDNYIADTQDILEKQELYEDNNIYDAYGKISYDAVVNKIPVVIITGVLPTYKGDKKDVLFTFLDPLHPELNFEDTCKLDVQGTSSQWYVIKNYKAKLSTAHQHYVNMQAAKVFCLKADYAEATGTHNTGVANYVHTLYGDIQTPAQQENPSLRTTVFGFPCVVFHRATENDQPSFVGKYNFNYDKGAENVYGFTSDFPLVESWEFSNNTSDMCLFHGNIDNSWTDNFEARYPDEYDDISKFKIMHDWVVSTYQDAATGENLDEPYTDVDGNEHTVDNAAYRLAKFKTEFTDHFDMGFSLLYYVFTLTMLMVDQRAKNMFLTSWDGVHWEPWLYDNDTCLGINNEGQLVFDYYHEDIDQLGSKNVYNGQTSTLWVNFRQAFGDEIKAFYQQLRSSGKVTFDEIYDWFITNHSNKWSISIYNEDADYKYISMLRSDDDASNLSQVRGTGKEHLAYFVKNRLAYLDSKFYAADYANDYATLRIYTPENWAGVTPNADITVTPYSNMYAGVRYKANGTLQQQRLEKNQTYTFDAPNETFNDTETAVYGASQISSLGDLSPLYCGSINVSKATKLKELIIGSSVTGYQNTNLVELSVGTNRLLKKIDVTNCPNLIAPLDLSGCPNIEEIYAKGSGITAVNLPASGYLKKMYLPETITNLTIQNQNHIEDFSCDGYSNLTTLRIENMSDLNLETIINSAANLNRVRLVNINATFANASALLKLADNTKVHGLDENGLNIDDAVVTGSAYIAVCNSDALATIQAMFPHLTITYGKLSYTVTFKSYDGTVVYTEDIESGGNAVNPHAYGYITDQDVAKPADVHYSYEFYGWDGSLNNITANRVLNATYTSIARMYEVKWINGENITTESIEYGTEISKPMDDEDCPYDDGAEYIWGGWQFDTYDDNDELIDSFEWLSSTVGGRTVATAKWYKYAVPDSIKSFSACDWGEIKAVCDAARAGTLVNNNGVPCDIDTWWQVHDEKAIKLSTKEEVVLKIAGFWLKEDADGNPIPVHIIMKHGLATARQMNYAAKYQYGYTVDGNEVEKSSGYTVNYVYDENNPQIVIEFTDYTFLSSVVRTIDGVATTWGFTGARSNPTTTRLDTQFSYEDCNLARTDGAKFTGSVVWNMNNDSASAITVDATGGSVNFYDTNMSSTDGAYRTVEFAPGSKLIIPMTGSGTVKINARQMWNAGGYFNSDLYHDIEIGHVRRFAGDTCEHAPLVEQFPIIIQKILTPFKLTSNIGGLTKEGLVTKVVRMSPPLANELQNSNSHFNQTPYTLERAYSSGTAGSRTTVADGRWTCYTNDTSRIITRGKNGAASYTWVASASRGYPHIFAYVHPSGSVYYSGANYSGTVFVGFSI